MESRARPSPNASKENLDIQVQIDDLGQLENGWHDGDGLAPSREGLDWLGRQFAIEYPDSLPPPYIFATPEGEVLAEWFIGPNSASLEVNLNDMSGYWHNLNMQIRKDEERTLDLRDSGEWAWLIAELQSLAKGIE